ncbi:initiation-specific alpha-16-mannosyltransferase [Anaeramoeba flamelloides]|uniref:Initiation-specific alpha-16-mannosyltransferase n=1 Tax=Anaeramoeba flamelloides TaxID=1746091 RepID=A0AAV8A7A7_9EUKA|nr:initiation-specific alpha-16-mannosyltransferase [Anaeramoeba flamelloides]
MKKIYDSKKKKPTYLIIVAVIFILLFLLWLVVNEYKRPTNLIPISAEICLVEEQKKQDKIQSLVHQYDFNVITQDYCSRWFNDNEGSQYQQQEEKEKNNQIIKNIYQIVDDKKEIQEDLQKYTTGWGELNQDYEHYLMDDGDLEQIISRIATAEEYQLYAKIASPVVRADFARILLIYYLGGVYADSSLDARYPLNQIISPKDECVLGIEKYEKKMDKYLNKVDFYFVPEIEMIDSFCNWFFACSPKHPLFRKLLDQLVSNLKRIEKNKSQPHSISETSGAHMLTKVVKEYYKSQGFDGIYILTPPEVGSSANSKRFVWTSNRQKLMKRHYSDNKVQGLHKIL